MWHHWAGWLLEVILIYYCLSVRSLLQAGWEVIEAPLELSSAIRDAAGPDSVLVIDCLTLWLSNLMHHDRDLGAETDRLLQALRIAEGKVVLVSNELGMGLAPMEALSRAFRDAQGRLNQRVAAAANRVEFVVAGLPMVLKG
jgi:adenosylcobinamide kinase/adenosylcobinamide-phosphate guanylyltransferase